MLLKKKLTLHLTLENPSAQRVEFSGSVTQNMTQKVFGKLNNQTMTLICAPHTIKSTYRNSFQYFGIKDKDIFEFREEKIAE
ncbi:unnamed protein product [Paramecium primaurelia]|uniref:Uncharacterized protein n=1 Tax=Paramecium primaurelia TaxID=5886 RepID=A0A8S1PRV9_PARPR|nr:unnamed protein product [Paramecium primaurelia]